MKRFIAILAIVAMLGGCAGTQLYQPPAGCEKDLVYRIPGFVPFGPMTVRTAVATAWVVNPKLKPVIAGAAKVAYEAVQAGNLLGATLAITGAVKGFEQYLPALIPAIALLEELGRAQSKDLVLGECDKNVLLSMFVNIGLDAGVDVRAGQKS